MIIVMQKLPFSQKMCATHIREEENAMLPKAKELDIDFEALGQRMLARKKELLKDIAPRL
jgi:hypothetical protein